MAQILVIEDEAYMCEIITAMLNINKHEVRCFNTGREGLQAYFDNPPDLLITDWCLPDVSGECIIDAIIEKDKCCRVLVSTGDERGAVENLLKVKKGLEYDVLLKPFSLADLVGQVDHFIN